jgi:hypothetical protein
MQLRMTLAEPGTVTIPSLFPVPRVQDAFAENGQALDQAFEKRAERLLDEPEWFAGALRAARPTDSHTRS